MAFLGKEKKAKYTIYIHAWYFLGTKRPMWPEISIKKKVVGVYMTDNGV